MQTVKTLLEASLKLTDAEFELVFGGRTRKVEVEGAIKDLSDKSMLGQPHLEALAMIFNDRAFHVLGNQQEKSDGTQQVLKDLTILQSFRCNTARAAQVKAAKPVDSMATDDEAAEAMSAPSDTYLLLHGHHYNSVGPAVHSPTYPATRLMEVQERLKTIAADCKSLLSEQIAAAKALGKVILNAHEKASLVNFTFRETDATQAAINKIVTDLEQAHAARMTHLSDAKEVLGKLPTSSTGGTPLSPAERAALRRAKVAILRAKSRTKAIEGKQAAVKRSQETAAKFISAEHMQDALKMAGNLRSAMNPKQQAPIDVDLSSSSESVSVGSSTRSKGSKQKLYHERRRASRESQNARDNAALADDEAVAARAVQAARVEVKAQAKASAAPVSATPNTNVLKRGRSEEASPPPSPSDSSVPVPTAAAGQVSKGCHMESCKIRGEASKPRGAKLMKFKNLKCQGSHLYHLECLTSFYSFNNTVAASYGAERSAHIVPYCPCCTTVSDLAARPSSPLKARTGEDTTHAAQQSTAGIKGTTSTQPASSA